MPRVKARSFPAPEEARIAYDYQAVHLQAKIKVRMDGKIVDTTMGRILAR